MSYHILIADSDPNMVVSLDYLMRRQGHRVQVAADGQAAWALMQATPPDLLILDVMLPGKTGFELLELLRARPQWEHLPVLVLTAKARETDIAKGLALGASAYMTKPFSTQALLAQVDALLAGRTA